MLHLSTKIKNRANFLSWHRFSWVVLALQPMSIRSRRSRRSSSAEPPAAMCAQCSTTEPRKLTTRCPGCATCGGGERGAGHVMPGWMKLGELEYCPACAPMVLAREVEGLHECLRERAGEGVASSSAGRADETAYVCSACGIRRGKEVRSGPWLSLRGKSYCSGCAPMGLAWAQEELALRVVKLEKIPPGSMEALEEMRAELSRLRKELVAQHERLRFLESMRSRNPAAFDAGKHSGN